MFLDDHQFHFIENLMPGKKSDPGRSADNGTVRNPTQNNPINSL